MLRLLFGNAGNDPRLYGSVLLVVAAMLGAATLGLWRLRGWRLSDVFAAVLCVILACLGAAMLIL
jgi:hypothetical protein